MKKYLIKLVNNDISDDIAYLNSCLKILERQPNDDFWLRKKQSLENRINKNQGYLRCLMQLDIKLRSEQTAQVSDTTKAQ